jgi:low temperature requirement protein LtrA
VSDEIAAESSAVRERHATNLELFLDLVFVFAVTQIASLISEHPSGTGTAKGLLMCVLVWWQWSQFTWAGSAVDLQGEARTRVLVLCLIPVTLIMTTSIPSAFGATGIWFGVAYFGVQALVLLAQGAYTSGAHRVAFVRYASFASIAPATVLAGAFFHGDSRVIVWVAAAVLNFIGGLRAAGGEWVIDPVHFSERHALFVIIGLGEVLVAAGAAATESGLHRHTAIAMTVAVAVACTMWWTYFAFIPDAGEHALRRLAGADRGRLARDIFTFGHFPIAFGIILYAVVVRHLVDHPVGHLSVDDRWLLGLSVAAVVGGLLGIQYRVVRSLAPERLAAVVVAAGVCLLGAVLEGTLVVGLVAVVYGVMQAITWRRISRGRSLR